MPKEEQKPIEVKKPFSHALQQIEGGQLNEDLADKMVELNATLSQYAEKNGVAKGKLKLELDFKLKDGILEIQSKVSIKAPEFRREASIFWLTPGNQLSAENPKQLTFGVRSIPAEQARQAPEAEPAQVRKI